jgi:phosphoglycolate phosphatase
VLEGKPSVHPLLALCKQAQVLPQDCVVVGDTCADTGMGRNAKAGLVVGVLTGTGTREYLLDHGADIVIPNIDYLFEILAMMGGRRSSSDLTEATYYSGSDDSEYDY